jgi:ketosteroid isomerase-like protein
MTGRSVSILLTLTLMGAGTARAQAKPTPPATATAAASADRAVLLRQEEGWAAALVKRDGAYFEKMLADGFVYTEDDRLMSRADVLRDATSGTDRVAEAHNEGMVVHLFGTTGVVTGHLVVSGTGQSGKFEHRYRFTDAWAKGADGRWKIVAAQDYLIPGK